MKTIGNIASLGKEKPFVSKEELVFASELPIFDKYDTCIPAELLRAAYAKDRLSLSEVKERIARLS
jgi:hypothetical protein